MQHLEVSGAVRHIYVIRRLKVNLCFKTCQQILFILNLFLHSFVIFNLKTKSVVKVTIFVYQIYKNVVGS